ncbi:MAG TPA: poly-gamma-glutamate hydrolase family protein [Anaerolineae bacterium]|nr:poly-gamma-glutamate hydrolase family protein [Anaerolineae bacterium]HOQ99351.1 poly-gamma-glutamate hydrolase family protein [Anaerolineae bacterium]HPL26788.1 poly-gamma-glutamate hydrolase family protein [Anaerolineae bacterium]
MPSDDHYRSFADLAQGERAGSDYQVLALRRLPVAVIAPHGGAIEPGTSELARAIAGDELSLYCFEGLKDDHNGRLHLASHRFDEPIGLALVAQSEVVVTIHGRVGGEQAVYVGGRDEELQERAIAALRAVGLCAERDSGATAGLDARNICNRGATGRGLQLEVSRGLRRAMFAGLSRQGRETTTPLFARFVAAVRGVLLERPPV